MQQAGLTVATAVTLGSGPVLVTIGARLTLGERSGAAGTVAVASGVAGLVLLMGGADGSTGPAPLLGIGYALLSAAGYAGVTLLGRFAGRENAGGAFESTVTGFAVGTVCLLLTALLEGLLPDMERPAWTAGLSLYLGPCRRRWRTCCSSSYGRPRPPSSPWWNRSPRRSSAAWSSVSGSTRSFSPAGFFCRSPCCSAPPTSGSAERLPGGQVR
ncbi:DMT family transporter [Streptomyces prasinus]|uniref:DMT family transporter n=1 Tax=Streptomyces prasinus TaxID=67345 RepID=UPI0006EBC801|nr:DMT family transporter [Streptomyces prasinus]